MTLFIVFLMAIITFTTRYLFIHPRLPIRLGDKLAKFLSYSAPAVLTAIWVPIIFVQQGQLDLSITNEYFIAAFFAVITAAKSKSVYLTMLAGGIVFVFSKFVFMT